MSGQLSLTLLDRPSSNRLARPVRGQIVHGVSDRNRWLLLRRVTALEPGHFKCDDTDASDIDILVWFAPGSSLFDLAHLSDELEQILGRPVDVVPEAALKPSDAHIRAEAVRVWVDLAPEPRRALPGSSIR